ncbi:MAG: SDR family NAD(P)-dependent oxidoreductase, partial [Pseudomonadota bacterium]
MEQCPPLSRSIAGRVAIVTGAASGMGRATAILFASEGAKVAVTDLDQAACDSVVAEIEANGGKAKAFALDVSNADAINDVVASVAQTFGGIDILVNNAGISAFCPLDAGEQYDAVWDRALAILLT